MIQDKNKRGATRYYPTMSEVLEMEADYTGACIGCGEVGQSAEPDAERYTCECCDKPLVYGYMWFALTGYIK